MLGTREEKKKLCYIPCSEYFSSILLISTFGKRANNKGIQYRLLYNFCVLARFVAVVLPNVIVPLMYNLYKKQSVAHNGFQTIQNFVNAAHVS